MDSLLPQMFTFSFISSGSFSTLLFLQTAEYFSENQEIWIFHQNRRCWIFHEIPCRREKSLPERDKELAFKERSHRRTIVKWGQQQELWLQEGQNIVVGTCRRSTSTISTRNVAAWQKQQIVRARCPKLQRIMKDQIKTTTKMGTTRKKQDSEHETTRKANSEHNVSQPSLASDNYRWKPGKDILSLVPNHYNTSWA